MLAKKENKMFKMFFAILAIFFGVLNGGFVHASPVYIDYSGFGDEESLDSYIFAEAGSCEGDDFHLFAESIIDSGEIDIVFCIDTTGSMFATNAVYKARNILMQLFTNGYDVNFGIITFGDEYNLTDFESDRDGNQLGDEMIDFNIRTASIGYDGFGEAAMRNNQLDAIVAAVEEYERRANSIDIVYLLTDSPFHEAGDSSMVTSFTKEDISGILMSNGTIAFAQFNTSDTYASAFYNNISDISGGNSYPLSYDYSTPYEDIIALIDFKPAIEIIIENTTEYSTPLSLQINPEEPGCIAILSENPIITDTLEPGGFSEAKWLIEIDSMASCDEIGFIIDISSGGIEESYNFEFIDGSIASEPCISWFPLEDSCIEYGSELGLELYNYFPEDSEISDYALISIDGFDRTYDCEALSTLEGTNIVFPDLLPGRSYEICIQIDEESIIPGPYCHEFAICEAADSSGDICPPAIVWETGGSECLHAWEELTFHFYDVLTSECSLQTGIDTSSLEISVNGVPVEVERGGPPLPPGPVYDIRYSLNIIDIPIEFFMMPFTVQISIRDMAGNYSVDSKMYTVCTIDVDSLPPVIHWQAREDSVSVRDSIFAIVSDSLIIPYAGLALDSFIVLSNDCGSPFPPLAWSDFSIEAFAGDSFLVTIFADDGFEPECREFCIQAFDHAGNFTESCIEIDFYNPPVDTFAPCISSADPAPDDTVGSTGIELVICDNCPISMPEWWVDPTTIELKLNDEEMPINIYSADLGDSTCNGARVIMNTGPIIIEGDYEVCLQARDYFDNLLNECYDFTVDYDDTSAPCVNWYGIRPPFYTDDLIDINLIAVCGGIEQSPINTAIVEVTLGGCGESPITLIEGRDYHLYGSKFDTLEISLRPPGGFDPGCQTVCINASDHAGNAVMECIDIDVIDESFEVSGFEALNGKHISCDDYCITLDYTGIIPDSFSVVMDSTRYTMASAELSYDEENIRFCTAFWSYREGNHYFHTAYGSAVFTIDYSSPYISRSYPASGDTISASTDSVVFYINDLYSDINGDSIRVLLGGELITIGEYGARYIWPESKCIIDSLPEGYFTPGEDIEIWLHVHDMIDECAPNYIDTNWTFYIEMPEDTIDNYYLDVTVTGAMGMPLNDMIVHLYDYYEHFIPLYEFEDVDTNIVFEVLPGEYSLTAMDPEFDYITEFYDNQTNPLEADPLIIEEDMPGTTSIVFSLNEIDHPSYFSVRGQVSVLEEGLDGCYVIAISSDEVEEEFSISGRTAPDGSFDIMLPNGTYRMMGVLGGYVPSFFGDTTIWTGADSIIVDGMPIEGIEIELDSTSIGDSNSQIGVIVFDNDTLQTFRPVPMRGARLYLYNDEEYDIYTTITNNLGMGFFNDIPPGRYVLIADKIGYYMHEESERVDVSYGDTIELVVNMIQNVYEANPFAEIPETFSMSVSPNPFNSTTKVSFNLNESGYISLHLINVRGEVIEDYDIGYLTPGTHSFILNPGELPTGLYLLGISSSGNSGNCLSYQKLLLVK